jgi:HK97 family phage portal protein
VTILLSKGLPTSVRTIAPGFERWGSPGLAGRMYDRYSTMAYEAIYANQPGVFAVVNRLIEGICRLPIKVYQFGGDGDSRERVRSRPRATRGEIASNPSVALANIMTTPWKGHSQWELKERLSFDLLLHGKALGWKLRPSQGALPVEFWPIPWWCVEVVWDLRGITAFRVYLDGTCYVLAPEDCAYLELVGHGTSPLEPLRRSIGIEDKAMDWQDEALGSGFSARAVFTTKIQMSDPKALAAARAQLDLLYSGPSGKQFAILGPDSDVKTLTGLSAVDLGLITARQSSREDVCACYSVQPSLLGFTTAGQPATYASAVEWRRSFYTDGIGPKITLIEELLNAQLVRSEPSWAEAFLKFDMTGLLRPDPESLARADMMDMQSATTVTNERRRNRQLPPIGDPKDPKNPANLPWIAGNGYPLGGQPEHVAPVVEPPAGQVDAGSELLKEAIRGDRARTTDGSIQP